MPDPAAPTLDTFNTGASQLLTARAGWSSSPQYAGDISLITDSVPTYVDSSNTNSSEHSNAWNTPFNADQEAGFVYGASVDDVYITTNHPTPGGGSSGYLFHVRWNGVGNEILNPSFSALTTWTMTAPSAGDSYCLQRIGTALVAFRKIGAGPWLPVSSTTDGTVLTGGYAGLLMPPGVTGQIDSFFAGNVITALPRRIAAWSIRSGS